MKKMLLGLFLIICACSFRSPNSQFYMLSSQGLPVLSEKNMSIAVAKVKVPDMLDKSQMVIYDGDSNGEVAEVKILEFQRWAEVYPDMLQNTITNDLIAYLPNAYVERTYFDSNKATYSVNIEVNQLKAYKNDKVVLSVWWNVRNAKGNIIERKQSMFEAKVEGRSISDLVAAQSNAVHKLSREIAEYLISLR